MTTERAVLAGRCFWGMQDLIRKMPGVVSTRVGYTGGDVSNASYRTHGTHAEGIEIVFDPAVLSYRRLLVRDGQAASQEKHPSGSEKSVPQNHKGVILIAKILAGRLRAAVLRRVAAGTSQIAEITCA